jgi:MFS family permease
MRLSWLTAASATWIMFFSRSLLAFTIGMVIYGLTAFVMSPLNSYVTAARGRWSVARAILLISACYNSGAIIGPLVGGYIGNHFGIRQIYLFAAIVFILSTIVIFKIEPQPIEPRTEQTVGGLLKNQRYFGFLAVIFITMFAMFLPQPLTANYLQNEHALSLDMIGKLGSVGSLGNVVLSLLFGRMAARSGYLISQISVAAFAFILWRGTGMSWFAVGYFLLGGYRTARFLAIAQVRDLVSEANMGLAYGIIEAVAGVTTILAPLLAGLLYTDDPVRVYTVSIGLMIFSFIISARYLPVPQGVKK